MADDNQIILAAMQSFTGLVNSKIKADLAKYDVDARIQAQKDATELSFERGLYKQEINNRTTIANNQYNATLGELKTKYDKLENLGMLEEEYVKKISDSADGTVDGIGILNDIKNLNLADFQTTTTEVEDTGSTLKNLEAADLENTEIISVLNTMLKDSESSIELAEKVKEVAMSDYIYLNDDLSEGRLMEIFSETYKEFIVNEDGSVLTDENGVPRPVSSTSVVVV